MINLISLINLITCDGHFKAICYFSLLFYFLTGFNYSNCRKKVEKTITIKNELQLLLLYIYYQVFKCL